MGGHDSFQIQSLIMKFEMNHTLPLALSKIITKLLWEVFPDGHYPAWTQLNCMPPCIPSKLKCSHQRSTRNDIINCFRQPRFIAERVDSTGSLVGLKSNCMPPRIPSELKCSDQRSAHHDNVNCFTQPCFVTKQGQHRHAGCTYVLNRTVYRQFANRFSAHSHQTNY